MMSYEVSTLSEHPLKRLNFQYVTCTKLIINMIKEGEL